METIRLVYPVEGGDLIEAGEASSKMKLTLKKLGLPQDVIRRASICMYEGEINMVIHADGGQAEVEVEADQIVIRMIDSGPGIPDVEQAMQEGYSTAGSRFRPRHPRCGAGHAGGLLHRRFHRQGAGLWRRYGSAQHEALLR